MKTELTTAVASAAIALASMVSLAEYKYIISDQSKNESRSAWSTGSAPISGVSSASIEAVSPVEARYRSWDYSEGIGIDPTLTRGLFILIR